MLRVALDQLTDGQLCWHRLPDPYDEVTLGTRRYQLRSGKTTFATALEEQFPEDKEAIREFMKISKVGSAALGGDISPGMPPAWSGRHWEVDVGLEVLALMGLDRSMDDRRAWVTGMVGTDVVGDGGEGAWGTRVMGTVGTWAWWGHSCWSWGGIEGMGMVHVSVVGMVMRGQ